MGNRPPKAFEAKANAISLLYRKKLGLKPHERLDALFLAEHMEIPVKCPTEVGIPKIHSDTIRRKNGGWSAITLYKGHERLIIHNTLHLPDRQQSNLFHELGHIICKHNPSSFDTTTGLPRPNFSKVHEDEANWMGSVLHVPKEALVYAQSQRMSFESVCTFYCASAPMVRWRVNMERVRLETPRISA